MWAIALASAAATATEFGINRSGKLGLSIQLRLALPCPGEVGRKQQFPGGSLYLYPTAQNSIGTGRMEAGGGDSKLNGNVIISLLEMIPTGNASVAKLCSAGQPQAQRSH